MKELIKFKISDTPTLVDYELTQLGLETAVFCNMAKLLCTDGIPSKYRFHYDGDYGYVEVEATRLFRKKQDMPRIIDAVKMAINDAKEVGVSLIEGS